MPRRKCPIVQGGAYHLYNRGHNRQTVFRHDSDCRTFLRAVRTYLQIIPTHADQASGATLLAWCLMPNHYHLIVQPADDGMSPRMQHLLISFTKTVNAVYGFVGALFQGQFQAAAVEDDEQLRYLTVYLHRNPVQAGLVRRPEDWQCSRCREYVGARPGTLPRPELVLGLCGGPKACRRLIDTAPEAELRSIENLILEE